VVDGLDSVQRPSRLSDGLLLVCHTDGSLSTLDTESGAVTPANAGHVGVLVGNGNMLNATVDPQGPAGYWVHLDPVQTSVRGTVWAWVEERCTPYLEECDR